MAASVNRVVLTGNLTQEPELFPPTTEGGSPRCRLRVAVNGRRKDAAGAWVEKPNFVSVTVWGAMADTCARFLSKGRGVAIDGRLEWHEWVGEDQKRREALQVIGEHVQFLGPRPVPASVAQEPTGADAPQAEQAGEAPPRVASGVA